MQQSLSYYVVMGVVKLTGIKKRLSQAPVDIKKARKRDVNCVPKRVSRKFDLTTFKIIKTTISSIQSKTPSDELLIFIHGGAFISGPTMLHWDAAKAICKATNKTIWLCDYPKAPEHNILEMSKNIDAIYQAALEKYPAQNIKLIGDSVGGTLVTALIQRLIQNNIALPKEIILVSPVMDASMCNPDIDKVEPRDPMLSKPGVLSAKEFCAQSVSLTDPIIAPLYGNFEGFPKTKIFVGENDIMYPDELLAIDKLRQANINLEVVRGKNMPHIWPYLPIMKEATVALKQIIKMLKA